MAFVAKSICFMLAENVWMIYLTQIFQTFSFALFASSSVFYADEVMDAQDKVRRTVLSNYDHDFRFCTW